MFVFTLVTHSLWTVVWWGSIMGVVWKALDLYSFLFDPYFWRGAVEGVK